LLKEHQAQQQQLANMALDMASLLSEARSYQNEVKTQAQTKQGLKARFRAMLDHYVLHREQLNAITQSRLIRELQETTREQLDHL
jgi:hypothetical protein